MANINLGPKQVTPDMPAHTPGVKQGNSRGNYDQASGHNPDGTSTVVEPVNGGTVTVVRVHGRVRSVVRHRSAVPNSSNSRSRSASP